MLTVALSATGVYTDDVNVRGRRFIGTYGVARDITERKRAEEKISFQAYHDLLTQLPNRILFKDRLGVALVQARRNRRLAAVLFIDLDRFKLVNDTLGHAEGDELLKGVAARLKGCLRRSDTLARLGGDEFTILLPDLSQPEDAAVIAEKVIEELRRPLSIAGQDIRATASIGVALYPSDGEDPDTLIKHADIAMYHVKAAGKNSYTFFSAEMNAAFNQRLDGRERSASCSGLRGTGTALSAADQSEPAQGGRDGGAGTLAASGARIAGPRPIHRGGRRGRIDHAHQRLGPGPGLRATRALACWRLRPVAHGSESVSAGIRTGRCGRARDRARYNGTDCRRKRWTSRSRRP